MFCLSSIDWLVGWLGASSIYYSLAYGRSFLLHMVLAVLVYFCSFLFVYSTNALCFFFISSLILSSCFLLLLCLEWMSFESTIFLLPHGYGSVYLFLYLLACCGSY